ncbi:MAG: hypothetical protein CME32_26765 [Gimesia sp.]|nr:hypothetical protein [Gimesia sp.]
MGVGGDDVKSRKGKEAAARRSDRKRHLRHRCTPQLQPARRTEDVQMQIQMQDVRSKSTQVPVDKGWNKKSESKGKKKLIARLRT